MKSREPRRKVIVPARLSTGPRWVDAVILNISSRGMLVRSEVPLQVGTYVDLRRGSQVIIGRAVWADGDLFGVRTQDSIDMDALLGERTGPRRQPSEGEQERRAAPRAPAATAAMMAERLERSRALSSMLQFALIGVVALAAAVFVASTVRDMLGRPAQAISAAMAR